MIKSSFIEMDFRSTGRATDITGEFSLSSLIDDFRRLMLGLPALGGSGRLNAFEPHSFDANGDDISEIVFNTSGVDGWLRGTLPSVKLRQRLNTGSDFVSAHDLILPLMMVLNDVGNWALSSMSSTSDNIIQSSSIDSIESEDRLLNERKQLDAVAYDGIFGGDGVSIRFGGNGSTKSNNLRHFRCCDAL